MSTSSKNNKIMKIENSSAIRNINFSKNDGIIGITFRQDKEYDFTTTDKEAIRNEVLNTVARKESVGSLIANLRREGRLEAVDTTA